MEPTLSVFDPRLKASLASGTSFTVLPWGLSSAAVQEGR